MHLRIEITSAVADADPDTGAVSVLMSQGIDTHVHNWFNPS
jgi:hypothetical protein